MKHAGPKALGKLQSFLGQLRKYEILEEKRPGIFYVKSKAFLHFHEDPEGIFMDAMLDNKDFSRFRVTTKQEKKAALMKVDEYVSEIKYSRDQRT